MTFCDNCDLFYSLPGIITRQGKGNNCSRSRPNQQEKSTPQDLFSIPLIILCYFLYGGEIQAQNLEPAVTGYFITDNNATNTPCTFAGEALLLNVTGTNFRIDSQNGNAQVQIMEGCDESKKSSLYTLVQAAFLGLGFYGSFI